jgi:hypothetical protein
MQRSNRIGNTTDAKNSAADQAGEILHEQLTKLASDTARNAAIAQQLANNYSNYRNVEQVSTDRAQSVGWER